MSVRVKIVIACVLWGLLGSVLSARAQQAALPAAGSAPSDARQVESHGWLALPEPEPIVDEESASRPKPGAVIVHIPPRAAQTGAGAADGTARLAVRIAEMPEAIAAVDARVYMVFPPSYQSGLTPSRRVLTFRAIRSPLGGAWGDDRGSGGRLDAQPVLEWDQPGGTPTLYGFVGTRFGPAAMLGLTTPTKRATLRVLIDGQWREAVLPGQPIDAQNAGVSLTLGPGGEPAQRTQLIFDDAGVALAVLGESAAGVYRGEFVTPIAESGAITITWTYTPLTATLTDPAWLGVVRGKIVIADRAAPQKLTLHEADAQAARVIAEIEGVGERPAFMPMAGVDRLAILWNQEHAPDDASPPPERQAIGASLITRTRHQEIREISLSTGRVLFAGPIVGGGPVSEGEYRLLAVLLFSVMIVVLLFVIRPGAAESAIVLPPGASMAEPGRRALAWVIDLVPAALFAARMIDVPLTEAFTPSFLIWGGTDAGLLVLLTLGAGAAHCTIGEWLTGRSLGKMFTGCEVIDCRPGGARAEQFVAPSFWQALLRNLVRWSLPPIAAAGIGEGSRRHRGDVLARTAVVIRTVEEAPVDSE